MLTIPFENTYLQLGKAFFVKTRPTPVRQPEMIKFNKELAAKLGLAGTNLDSTEGLALFAGNQIPAGAEPIAMAYAGHQFGHFNTQLGDGRALLLGEIVAPDTLRYDIQLKGSGPTDFSRGGDGRAALGPVLREYLVSEAMAKLGVPTTRALAAVSSGEEVARTQLLPGAILTRIATSYVRVGTFQYFAARGNDKAIQQLADYVIHRNYPDATHADNPYLALFEMIIARQAQLLAQWMQLGFIHGVMNTDNMSIAGETIDYGPCAFMDHFNQQQVYSSIDRQGRYAYHNQPAIAQWNLTRLAECLIPLLADDAESAIQHAQEQLDNFQQLYHHAWLAGMRQKTGLSQEQENDAVLIHALLTLMHDNQADFTLTFYHLSRLTRDPGSADRKLHRLFKKTTDLNAWLGRWRERLSAEPLSDSERQQAMQAVNPVYIPRNHRIEAAIRAAEDHQDFTLFHQLHHVLQKPYEEQPGQEQYKLPPLAEEVVQQTFCGT